MIEKYHFAAKIVNCVAFSLNLGSFNVATINLKIGHGDEIQ